MPDKTEPTTRFLSADHAASAEVGQEWDQNNQQWWDWYMSLAENQPGESEQPLLEVPESNSAPAPSREELEKQLAESFPLSADHIQAFRRDGFIKLKHVISPGALALLRQEMGVQFERLGDQSGTRFGSLEMMWESSEIIREFVFSRRLAKLATELLGVSAIRLYHDNGLSKQPGCGRTPWHYDAHHFPIATENVVTVWVPLQAIPASMGPLGFARGMQVVKLIEDIPFNKFDASYDRRIMERLHEQAIEVNATPFDLGEVSFHHNLNLHTAGPNRTTTPRMVLATTYFEDGARVIDAPHMVNGDWRRFMPGVEPGDVIDTPLNPVLYER